MSFQARFAPFVNVVFSHKVAAVAAGSVVLIVLGCMCLNFGGESSTPSSTPSSDDSVLRQGGTVNVPPHSDAVVYYPIPYSNVPNLTIDDTFHHLTITEQKEDHFRVASDTSGTIEGTWKARGLRVQPPVVVSPPPPPPAASEPGPAPQGSPVPVQIGQPK
jgi:hypothetical protein